MRSKPAAEASASKLRQPYNLWQVATIDATLALVEGRFSEVEQLSLEALAIGQEAENRNAVALCGVQILALKEEGRLAELEPGMRAFVEQYPASRAGVRGWPICTASWATWRVQGSSSSTWPHPISRCSPATCSGQEHDAGWRDLCLSGRRGAAELLYQSLAPYAEALRDRRTCAACSSSVERYLGQLAATLGRLDDAAAHLEKAIAVNDGIRAWPLVAHTRYDFASLLLARRQPGDRERALELLGQAIATAQELGMKRLGERAQSLKSEAEAVTVD